MLGRLVAADDRTGAFEAAAWMASVGAPVTVWVGSPGGDGVVDLGTRDASPDRAAAAVSGLPAAAWRAHKTDSLLRGNWPAELRALGGRVLFVPAWPDMDRVCVGGVVHAGGVAVGAIVDRLPEAELLADDLAVHRWLASGTGIGVADVATTDRLNEVTAAAADAVGLVVAGPAGAVGAAHTARFGPSAPEPCPVPSQPLVVVNGSASPIAHEQVRRLRTAHPAVEVLSVPEGAGELRAGPAEAVVAQARDRLSGCATLVVIGGHTAAALLGDAPRRVGGFVAPGMPWSLDETGGGPLVVTKAGAFGGPDALLALRLPCAP